MLGHCASTQTVLSLSSPMDSRRRAYFSPCAARCRSHAGFFTSGSLPVYGPTGALAAVPTGGAASARHRTTETEPRGSPLPPRPAHTGGRSGRASELCIAAGGIGGAGFRGLVVVWGRRLAAVAMGSKRAMGEVCVAVLPLVRGRTSNHTWMVSEGRGKMGIKYEGGDDTKDGFGPFWSKTAYGLICNEFDQKSTLHWPKTGRKAVAKFERIGEGAFVS